LRTPAPVRAAPPSWGRHPQTFTKTDFTGTTAWRKADIRQIREDGNLKLILGMPFEALCRRRRGRYSRCWPSRLAIWSHLRFGRS